MNTATSSMPENIPNPTMVLSATPVAKFRSVNTVRSRNGSLAVSSRMRKPASAHTAMMLSAKIIEESNQSSRSPRSRTSWRHPNPATMRASPRTSIRAVERFRYGGSKRNTLAMRKPITPTGRLM